MVLDLPDASYAAGSEFWGAVTGYESSLPCGVSDESVTLVPADGDPHIRIQRVRAAPCGVHVDMHVADVQPAVDHALALGAALMRRPGHVVMRSPAGFAFCLVESSERTPAQPVDWGTHRSRVDQLTIDVALDDWERELSFWSDLTGWALTQTRRSEFTRLSTPARLPVRILLQRLERGETHGHLDIAAEHRRAEVERLIALGATTVSEGPVWTVMASPDGSEFCVTDRDPDTGLLPD